MISNIIIKFKYDRIITYIDNKIAVVRHLTNISCHIG